MQRPIGLYDPASEHDACGFGAVVRLSGDADHELVGTAIQVLERLDHRGATGADENTGDGAGILVQPPDRFLRRVFRDEAGIELPTSGDFAVGIVFLPRDPGKRLRCEEICVRIAAEEGHRALGWRDVPVVSGAIGTIARRSEPIIRMLAIERRTGDGQAFGRSLYVIRRRVEKAAQMAGVADSEFNFTSLSPRTIVYKGLLTALQLAAYFPDLSAPDFRSAIALVHSRFSTNTLGTWDLAHPYNMIAHNGEINTVRGNHAWLVAREPQLRSELLGRDLQKLFPIAEARWSDSAKLDAVLELLVQGGRDLAHALAILIPPAWSDRTLEIPDDVRAFHEYHTALMEPWDGPAAIVATDGDRVVATLDRNGLRPGRYTVTHDGLVVLASEAGVVDADPAEIVEAGRLEGGRMMVLDTIAGRIVRDDEVKRVLARRQPYRQWLNQGKLHLDDLRPQQAARIEPAELLRLHRAFGYTSEDLRLVVGPMARDGYEATGSMGDDTPLAALSSRPKLLAQYFKQHFAQVTNPPIDPVREELVMHLGTGVGAMGNLLAEEPEACRRVILSHPILQNGDLEKLRHLRRDRFRTATLSTLYPVEAGAAGIQDAVDRLCREASSRVWDGHTIIILSDRGVSAQSVAIPPILACAAVHSHLVREGARTMCSIVVESGEPRETMHFALLIGYGASAVNPYVALDTLAVLQKQGDLGELTLGEARASYVRAIGRGLLKICSKMGISTIQSYRGAQIFEAVGLGPELIARYFPGTASRVGGLELQDIADENVERHRLAFLDDDESGDAPELDPGGEYQLRLRGEDHTWNPSTVAKLQRAVRDRRPESYEAYAAEVDAGNAERTLRGLLDLHPAAEPIEISEVEPSSSIVRRFATGAMSLGSISPEAHEALAIAMNRLGGRSNTGEGGEDARRSTPDANGDSRRSAIKQVASARFGVTAGYLCDADQLQIKVAQGAKPGEGGQLPGSKVDVRIAALRHSTPGVGLISPPPHHDIYSIEDLAQLIHDLKSINPRAEISVKLVAEAGVGTIAAGVAKAKADHIVIAGFDGGTGASPLSSLKHCGLPWELGLAETQQVLVMNDLRGRIRLQVDGGLRTGRDVVVGAILGAEEFAFSTAPLIAAGCIMMRVCHLNTCPVGIATQDPVLRERFTGTPEHVVAYFIFVAEQVREILASLGLRSVDDLIGRTDLLAQRTGIDAGWLGALDLGPILEKPGGDAPERKMVDQDHRLSGTLDHDLITRSEPALAAGEPVRMSLAVRNVDRSVGAMLAGEVVRRVGAGGLADGTIAIDLHGSGGQSFGAWLPAGVTITLSGVANDYLGKGLSGGRIVVAPPHGIGYAPEANVVAGNTLLYGATAGEAFLSGLVGERFCVRNSGATAVVEGVGDHGCEYMTGGTVVVLGPTGRNFAAGMSGGIAYVADPDDALERRLNGAMVDLEDLTPDDVALVRELVARHVELTGSALGRRLLARPDALGGFRKVMPHDLKRTLAEVPEHASDVGAVAGGPR